MTTTTLTLMQRVLEEVSQALDTAVWTKEPPEPLFQPYSGRTPDKLWLFIVCVGTDGLLDQIKYCRASATKLTNGVTIVLTPALSEKARQLVQGGVK